MVELYRDFVSAFLCVGKNVVNRELLVEPPCAGNFINLTAVDAYFLYVHRLNGNAEVFGGFDVLCGCVKREPEPEVAVVPFSKEVVLDTHD